VEYNLEEWSTHFPTSEVGKEDCWLIRVLRLGGLKF